MPLEPEGTALDACLIFDLNALDEWTWVRSRYGPLYATNFVWAELDPAIQSSISAHVKTQALETEAELVLFAQLAETLRKDGDASTVALCKAGNLRCGSNEKAIYRICRKLGVPVLRLLRIISDMNAEGYKSKVQCIEMFDGVRLESGPWIKDDVIREWKASLR